MYSEKVVITNRTGLHARPASEFVKTASKFKSKLTLQKGSEIIDPKSILDLLSAGISQGTEITITAEGEDERESIRALVGLIMSDFGE